MERFFGMPGKGRRSALRRVAFAALTGALVTAMLPLASASAAAPDGPRLSKGDRRQLAQAKVDRDATVRVLIATTLGSGGQVVAQLERLGGRIEYRDDELGYLRASVPTNNVERAGKSAGIIGFELDAVIPMPGSTPGWPDRPDPVPAAGRDDAAEQPLHADRRYRCGAVPGRPPDLGRARRHRRRRSTPASPRPPGPR